MRRGHPVYRYFECKPHDLIGRHIGTVSFFEDEDNRFERVLAEHEIDEPVSFLRCHLIVGNQSNSFDSGALPRVLSGGDAGFQAGLRAYMQHAPAAHFKEAAKSRPKSSAFFRSSYVGPPWKTKVSVTSHLSGSMMLRIFFSAPPLQP